MSRIYAAGAAMGWTAAQTKTTSMWEFWSAWHGYVKANSPKGGERLSEAEKDDLWADIEAHGEPTGPLSTKTYLWDGTFQPQGVVSFRL